MLGNKYIKISHMNEKQVKQYSPDFILAHANAEKYI